MTCDLVVFDMAGTTVWDPDYVSQAVIDALGDQGIEISVKEINPYMGIPKPLAIQSVLRDLGHEWAGDEGRVQGLFEGFRQKMLEFYRTSDEVRAIEGAEETFVWLRDRGVKVALDTGFSRDIVDVILGRLGWDDGRLDAMVASDEVEKGRPYPDLLLEAMRRTGVSDASRVAKVGDTPSDIGEGVSAGCGWVIGVTEGTHSRDQLEGLGATHLVGSVVEVPGVLEL